MRFSTSYLAVGMLLASLFAAGWIGSKRTQADSEVNSHETTNSETAPRVGRRPGSEAMAQLDGLLPRGGRAGGRVSGGGRGSADRSQYPQWKTNPLFPQDNFTFVRIEYDSGGFGGGRGRGGSWANDFPDCDWNFSFRLQQLTSMQVDPNGRVIRLTDPELFDYPFIYMSNMSGIVLSLEEQVALRRYLEGGGFLMSDDFWAPAAWRHIRSVIHDLFPNRPPRELPESHEIFHIVYDLKGRPQIPSIRAWLQGEKFEYWHGDPEGDEGAHFWGLFDDDERLMAIFCHNNDIGDGWEREGENHEYFEEYSVKVAYPLGINIVTYAMTH